MKGLTTRSLKLELLRSHDCNLGTWQLVCTYSGLPNAPWSCKHHVESSLSAFSDSHCWRDSFSQPLWEQKTLPDGLIFPEQGRISFASSIFALRETGWKSAFTNGLLHPALAGGLISSCSGQSFSSREKKELGWRKQVAGLEKTSSDHKDLDFFALALHCSSLQHVEGSCPPPHRQFFHSVCLTTCTVA